jgi:hypothetical protein
MTDELKPCPNPWCESPRPPFLVWNLYHRRVHCLCGVRGPSSEQQSLDGVPHDVIDAEAAAAWNTRADAAEQRVATLEAALPAVYQMAWEDAYQEHPFNAPTPTAAELMARIQTGEKE